MIYKRVKATFAYAKDSLWRSLYPKVGRNDPCPCGSGKKYKKCHGRSGSTDETDD